MSELVTMSQIPSSYLVIRIIMLCNITEVFHIRMDPFSSRLHFSRRSISNLDWNMPNICSSSFRTDYVLNLNFFRLDPTNCTLDVRNVASGSTFRQQEFIWCDGVYGISFGAISHPSVTVIQKRSENISSNIRDLSKVFKWLLLPGLLENQYQQ